MQIQPIFAWYDFWIGLFYDRKNRKLYVLPVPCIGVVITFAKPQTDLRLQYVNYCRSCALRGEHPQTFNQFVEYHRDH